MIKVKYKGLSRKGAGKLKSLISRVPLEAQKSLKRNFMPTKRAIVGFSPTSTQEREELSRGVHSSGIVGDGRNGRFSKLGAQRYVRDALTSERPVVSAGKNLIQLMWGNVSNINLKIGFSWVTSKGQVRQTSLSQPLWGNLIQAWEGRGGSHTARIVPRGPYPLRPTDALVVPYMDKTIPQYHMVERGYNATRIIYRKKVAKDIKNIVRKIGTA